MMNMLDATVRLRLPLRDMINLLGKPYQDLRASVSAMAQRPDILRAEKKKKFPSLLKGPSDLPVAR